MLADRDVRAPNAKKALVLNFVARELFEKFSLRRLAVFLKWSKLPLNRHFLAFKFLKASLKELSAIYRINAKRVKLEHCELI